MARLAEPRFAEPLQGAIRHVTDDVSVRILQALTLGPQRYSAFALGVSSKTLATRLKSLERHGLVTRTMHAEMPVRVEYALTQRGAEMLSIVQGLREWELSWQKV